MKHFLTFVFLFTSGYAFSQDTIVFHDGKTVVGKVLEISNKEIRYKLPDNPDGPVYVARRGNVRTITYQNGKQEIFNIAADRKELFMKEKMARHLVYAEIGGNGVRGFSFNYDYTFFRKDDYGFTARLGINPGFNNSNYLTLPATVSFLYGHEAALEFGGGIITANYTEHRWDQNDVQVTRFIPTGIFGFRYQKRNGFSVRMSLTPLFLMKQFKNSNDLFDGYEIKDQNMLLTLGISAGYAF